MPLIRMLALSSAVVAMLGVPILQSNAEAQGRGTSGDTSRRPLVMRTAPARGVDRVVVSRRVVAPRRGGVVIGAYYRPLYYSPFYSPFYDPFYAAPYRFGAYPGYHYAQFYRPESALRIQVSPRNTQVFVDGYYAGIVDDFDGVFQRLRLEPGTHELTLYLPGFHTFTQQLFLQPDRTFNLKQKLLPLAPGEAPDPRPVAPGSPPPQDFATPTTGDADVISSPAFGTIAVRVQPAEADVLVDGERWEGPQDDEALVLQVAPGRHNIEVRRNGYRSYTAEIDVRPGQTTPLNVSLPQQ